MHPALPDDPGHEIWQRDFAGSSGLFGIVLHPCPPAALAAMLDGMRLFGIGSSWGGYESLMPAGQSGSVADGDEMGCRGSDFAAACGTGMDRRSHRRSG